MDLISKALHYLGENYPQALGVQVGAMDGINFDDTRGFFDKYKWKSIMVEPVPDLFKELQQNLGEQRNLLFEQCAIGDTPGFLKMITIPVSAIEENNLHPGYKGMSAVYPLKNGFGRNYSRDIEVREKFGVDIEVPCLTFDELIEKHNFIDVNILICDAEGYDWQIFKTIDLKKYDLQFIRLEYVNLTDQEKEDLVEKLNENGYVYEIGFNIDAIKRDLYEKIYITKKKKNYTIVSGLWDINRPEREFQEFYMPRFLEFLKIDANLFLFLPSCLVDLVWEHRTKENTHIQVLELEDLREGLYKPHWELTQKIRQNQEWQNITGEHGWLKKSPQATLEYYNPIVQSKMFMLHDASIYNIFDTDLFYWMDAGITKTVAPGYLEPEKYLDKLPELEIPFLFLSYPYLAKDEIHGFSLEGIKRYCESDTEYVCRGGFFGGSKDVIRKANALYYTLLQSTLAEGFMGTEESIFTIMSYIDPVEYRRYMLDDNGLILKFFDALGNKNVNLEPIPVTVHTTRLNKDTSEADLAKLSTNLYILTFNFPEQLVHTIESMEKTPELLQKPNLFLLDNSTDSIAKGENKRIAEANNFGYIDLGGNRGINGGRQAAAEHFEASNADFMFFFEDDMTVNPPEYIGQFCRNGFRKYIPNLYQILHKIMLKESFDFLKLSFTEVYWDNNIQTSWYNVPQYIRTEVWPSYDKLPITGADSNSPRTRFGRIENVDGLAYITGEIFYCNWPMIVSKEGNRKMFIDTKWAHPYEQTWMSYMFQETLKGNIKPGLLLASPIWHERIAHYSPEERREN